MDHDNFLMIYLVSYKVRNINANIGNSPIILSELTKYLYSCYLIWYNIH